jgi:hypothetical protein
MSHPGVKIVSAWLEDVTNGVNACAAAVPRISGHSAPPSLTVYDEIDDAWVARGISPDEPDADASITFPALTVKCVGGTWDDGMGQSYESGRIANGTVDIACEIVQLNVESVDALRDAMYLLRGLRASLILLNNAPQTNRDECNTTVVLWPSTAMRPITLTPQRGDKVSAIALVVTYPVWESTPATA